MRSLLRTGLVALCLPFATALPAQSQTYLRKYAVHGQVGAARVYDEEGKIGTGLFGGAGFGFRFHKRLGADFEIFRFRHERNVAGGLLRFAGTGTFYVGNVLFYLSEGRVQPYLVGGLGALHYTNRSNLAATPATNWTRFAGSFGFGVQGFVTPRVPVRPEARVSIGGAKIAAGIEPPISALRLSIGVGYHW